MDGREAAILLIEDDAAFAELLASDLESMGLGCTWCPSVKKGIDAFDKSSFDLVVLDWFMSERQGDAFIRHVKENFPATYILVASGDRNVDAQCTELGADEFVEKGTRVENVVFAVRRALKRHLDKRTRELTSRTAVPAMDALIGDSKSMDRVRELVRLSAASDFPVLITGESGTGKRLVARAVHECSRRAEGQFVVIDCAALPESIAESELFGHVKGAFTNATARVGLFELAHRGTAFLDDVNCLPLSLQPKLLRVLEEQVVRRVGAGKEKRVDVRVIAATNRPLKEEVRQSRFRDDLRFRLDVLRIDLSSLRERPEDVPVLTRHFLQQRGRPPDDLTDDAIAALQAYAFPGNVRELEKCIVRATALCPRGSIGPDHLGLGPSSSASAIGHLLEQPFREAVREFEKLYLSHWIPECDTIGDCAERIGLSRSQIHRKIKDLKLK